MPDFDQRSTDAVRASEDVMALPLDRILDRANKALADKEWPTAVLLFQKVSLKAVFMANYAMEQEIALLKGAMNGPQEG